MTRFRFALLSTAFLLLGCGGSNYNSTCTSSSQCTGGLFCPTVGPMQGKCTKNCTKDEECSSLGSNLVCTSDVCTPR